MFCQASFLLILQDHSGSIRHLSYLFCRIILVSSHILPDCCKSLAITLQILLPEHIFLHPGCAGIPQISICPFMAMYFLYIYVYLCYKILLALLQCYGILIYSHSLPCCCPKSGVVYPVCETPVYTQSRGILFQFIFA